MWRGVPEGQVNNMLIFLLVRFPKRNKDHEMNVNI